MRRSNLENLVKNRHEILKAEIGSILFNLGKTHIGFWEKKGGEYYWRSHFGLDNIDAFKEEFKRRFGYETFSGYKDYYGKIMADELKSINSDLHDFILAKHKVKIPGEDSKQEEYIDFFEFIKGSESSEGFVKNVFFRGCENINSGIDKGSPSSKEQQLRGVLWLANAFSGFKRKIDIKDLDEARISFYRELDVFLASRGYYKNPAWDDIRNFVVRKIKAWYSLLLSDSRFPINDVTLWDQAFMSASMFKAILAELFLNPSLKNRYISKPGQIRWRVLGVQYDRLGFAEKGYKPEQIQWYRETTREIDNEIKWLLEYEYPIGNEIYRDETGIYFLVGESLGKNIKDSYLAYLHPDLNEVKDKILEIFKNKSQDEFYPAIFLTRASRGLMNLTYLLEKAEENFLQADWSKKDINLWLEDPEKGIATDICLVCRQRLVFKSDRQDEDKNICDFCYKEKTRGRLKKWINNRNGETIWMSELKDRNGKVALVTLKFELADWLSGDMLNSLLVSKNEEYEEYIAGIKNFIILLLSSCEVEKYFDSYIENYDRKIEEIDAKLKKTGTGGDEKKILGSQKGKLAKEREKIETIKDLIDEIRSSCWWKRSLKDDLSSSERSVIGKYENKYIEGLCNHLQKEYEEIKKKSGFNIPFLEYLIFFPAELAGDAYEGCKSNNESFEDFIDQVFFGSVVGSPWEQLVNDLLEKKIDLVDTRKIKWDEFRDEADPDLDVFARLLFQFLTRKNPSPARLRRIWETTREFFKEIAQDICSYADIPETRRRRYYWKDKNIPEGEYFDDDLLFWSNGKHAYLISYYPHIENHIENSENRRSFRLKEYSSGKDTGEELKLEDANEYEHYIPCMSIMDPTPVSWQFAIPAEHVPALIDRVMMKYDEYFKFVYGKLPLHIGVIIQDYKKPLYVGIKALRKIRRDVKDREKLYTLVKAEEIKKKLKNQRYEEKINLASEYYSLYWGRHNEGYEFFVKPDKGYRKRLVDIEKLGDDELVYIIPNTFDFEFMDTNMRRNDIYYMEDKVTAGGEGKTGVKRSLVLKSGRPYEIERYWGKFKKFRELFGKNAGQAGKRGTRLEKLVSVIYEKIDCVEKMKPYLASCFINVLGLNWDMELRKGMAEILEMENEAEADFYKALLDKMTAENMRLFLDMFEFWHTALGEV